MKILVDENMPYAEALFGRLGDVKTVAGRAIPAPTLALAEALMVRSITGVDGALLDGSRVKFVGTATAGTDHVDEDWLAQAGIGFSAAPGCNAIAVVEYVFSALLWLAQRDGFALCDKTVGVIGVGNVGGRLQRRLNAFGVRTLLCDLPLAEAGAPGDWQPLEGDKPLSVVLDVWELEPALSLPLLARVDIATAHIAAYTLEGKARGTTQVFDAYSAYIVAVADALNSQLLLAVKPLTDLAGLGHLHVSNLLSASANGKAAVDDLVGQSACLLNALPAEPGFFPRQLAFNLLPLVPDDVGSVRSERRLVDEVRKILRDEGLPISVSSVQAPIFYGHAQLVHLETLRPMAAEEARVALAAGEGLTLSEELDYPTPVEDASGNIGCLRNDYGMPDLLQFWSVADNVRFGGALMAVLTAEKLMTKASAW